MEALKLTPVYKDYLWGGQKLKQEFGKQTDLPVVAESWELSLNECGLSQVAGTEMTLRDWLHQPEDFPILVKLIDAKQDLSVQVHPNETYARAREGGHGKTEMWYVVDHEPDAVLYIGWKRQVTKADIIGAIREHCLPELLRKITVRKGDVYAIPAGTVHAIGKGNLLAEVQQNSDFTYRLYDYGRLGSEGKARPLHVEKALDVMDLSAAAPIEMRREVLRSDFSCRETLIHACKHFTVYRVETMRETVFTTIPGVPFELLLFLDGDASVTVGNHNLWAKKGDSVFITATPGVYRVGGDARFLRIFGEDVSGREKTQVG